MAAYDIASMCGDITMRLVIEPPNEGSKSPNFKRRMLDNLGLYSMFWLAAVQAGLRTIHRPTRNTGLVCAVSPEAIMHKGWSFVLTYSGITVPHPT